MDSKFGVVVMGVSGSGKTTVGQRLAERWHCPFIEGDQFHSRHNVKKMKRGEPLNDDDRSSWLLSLAGEAHLMSQENQRWVLSCSALKPKYRDVFRTLKTPVFFLHLTANRKTLAERIEARTNHFMPATLLSSQLADLSVLANEQDVISVPSDQPLDDIVEAFGETIKTRMSEAYA